MSCLELPAVQDRPALFSTVMMWLVAELFEQLPEAGDLAKPKLVFFLDEAHLLFADATDAFVESVARTVRLIRSKGVGVFFVTQAPTDLPEEVLGQLGSRVQHALRAFTPKDAKDLKAVVSTYPTSDFYDVGELLTSMGTGEAAVTLLSEAGVPTPVVHTRMLAPASRMAPAADVAGAATASPLFAKYGTRVETQSARELLAGRLEAASEPAKRAPAPKAPRPRARPRAEGRRRGRDRRLPHLTAGEGAAARGDARRVRDAAQAALNPSATERDPQGVEGLGVVATPAVFWPNVFELVAVRNALLPGRTCTMPARAHGPDALRRHADGEVRVGSCCRSRWRRARRRSGRSPRRCPRRRSSSATTAGCRSR